MPNASASLIAVEAARERVAGGGARLLVVGKGEPHGALPRGASFVEARAFRDEHARGVAGPAALETLCARCGVAADTPVVLADARGGPHAALAFWTLALYGHASLALVDGGWPTADGAPSRADENPRAASYRPGPPRFEPLRAGRDDVRHALDGGGALLDVRSRAEFSGTLTAPVDVPQEGILRGGHLPGAVNVPHDRALRFDGCFHPRGELAALYGEEADLDVSEPVVVYSRVAARACHTWFALTHVLGFEAVRVYDGGWAEWGNLVAAPIARGTG